MYVCMYVRLRPLVLGTQLVELPIASRADDDDGDAVETPETSPFVKFVLLDEPQHGVLREYNPVSKVCMYAPKVYTSNQSYVCSNKSNQSSAG
jgi:hypothetical protein